MPQDIVTWLIAQGPLGVVLALVLLAFVWVVKKWTDSLDQRDNMRVQHTEALLSAAQREKEEVRASAALASEVKNVMQSNTSALQALLVDRGR